MDSFKSNICSSEMKISIAISAILPIRWEFRYYNIKDVFFMPKFF